MLMLSTMAASYYIVFKDEFAEYSYHTYKDKMSNTKSANKAEIDDFKKLRGLKVLLNWISKDRSSNILPIFYALLNLFLMLDVKDIFVFLIYGLQTVVVPVHLLLHATATPEDPKLNQIYFWYIPVFVSCISLVLFRYLLFFQK